MFSFFPLFLLIHFSSECIQSLLYNSTYAEQSLHLHGLRVMWMSSSHLKLRSQASSYFLPFYSLQPACTISCTPSKARCDLQLCYLNRQQLHLSSCLYQPSLTLLCPMYIILCQRAADLLCSLMYDLFLPIRI